MTKICMKIGKFSPNEIAHAVEAKAGVNPRDPAVFRPFGTLGPRSHRVSCTATVSHCLFSLSLGCLIPLYRMTGFSDRLSLFQTKSAENSATLSLDSKNT